MSNSNLFLNLRILLLLFWISCGCQRAKSNKVLFANATSQVWVKDTCGALGYRSTISEILYEQYKTKAKIKSKYIENLIGAPDTIILRDLEMKWHYLVEGINCNETYYALSVN